MTTNNRIRRIRQEIVMLEKSGKRPHRLIWLKKYLAELLKSDINPEIYQVR